jgi:hypothetical protein
VRTAKQRARATTTKAKKAAKPAKDSPATLEGFNMGTNKRRRKMRELLNKVAYPLTMPRIVGPARMQRICWPNACACACVQAETGYTDDVFQAKDNDVSVSLNISEDEWQPTRTTVRPPPLWCSVVRHL